MADRVERRDGSADDDGMEKKGRAEGMGGKGSGN